MNPVRRWRLGVAVALVVALPACGETTGGGAPELLREDAGDMDLALRPAEAGVVRDAAAAGMGSREAATAPPAATASPLPDAGRLRDAALAVPVGGEPDATVRDAGETTDVAPPLDDVAPDAATKRPDAGGPDASSPDATAEPPVPLEPCQPGQRRDPFGLTLCLPCPVGSFSDTLDAETCRAFTLCGAGEYESVAPTSVSDRICEQSRDCGPGTFVLRAATEGADAECAACASGTFSAGQNADACTPWTQCPAGYFEASTPDALGDRVCAPITHCQPGEYQAQEATATQDAVCAPCAAGSFASETDALACRPWSVCPADSYEMTPPGPARDRGCAPVTVCAPGQYVASLAGGATDAVCRACPAGSFSTSPNSLTCLPWTQCSIEQKESAAPSATRDRVCVDINSCGPGEYVTGVDRLGLPSCAPCPSGFFSDVENAAQCTMHARCEADEFEWLAPDAAHDRECSRITSCPPGAYVSGEPTATTDRQCSACLDGFSVATNAPACSGWRDCPAGTVVTVEPSGSQDRQCGVCDDGFRTLTANAAQCIPEDFMSVGAQSFALQSLWVIDSGSVSLETAAGAVAYSTRRFEFFDAPSWLAAGDIYGRGVEAEAGASKGTITLYLPAGESSWDGYVPVLDAVPDVDAPEVFALVSVAVGGELASVNYVGVGGEVFFERIAGALAFSATDVMLEGVDDGGIESFSTFYIVPEQASLYYGTGPHMTANAVSVGEPIFSVETPPGTGELWRFAWTGEYMWGLATPPPEGEEQHAFFMSPTNGAYVDTIIYEPATELDFVGFGLFGYDPGDGFVTLYNEALTPYLQGQLTYSDYLPLRGLTADGTWYRWIGVDPNCESCRTLVTDDEVTGEAVLTNFDYELDDMVYAGGALWISAGRGNILKLDAELNLLDVYHVTDHEKFGVAETADSMVMNLDYIDDALFLLDQHSNFYRLDL